MQEKSNIYKEDIPLVGSVMITIVGILALVEGYEIKIGDMYLGGDFFLVIATFLFWILFAYALFLNRFQGDLFFPLLGAALCFPISFFLESDILTGIGMVSGTLLYFFRHRNKGRPLVKYEKLKAWLILSILPLVLLQMLLLELRIIGLKSWLVNGLLVMEGILSLPLIVIFNHSNLYSRKRLREETSLEDLVDELGTDQ